MRCECSRFRRVNRTVKPGARFLPGKTTGLGFTIDWGGIASNAIQAFGAVSVAKNQLRIQQAQQEAALRAQQAELQLMQRRQAQSVAQPVGGSASVLYSAHQPKSLTPGWLLPAAVIGAGLFLMRK